MSQFSTPGPQFADVNVIHSSTVYGLASDLVEAQITLSADSMTGQAIVTARDDSAQYGTFGSPLFEIGDLLQVYVYKRGQSPTTYIIFSGPVLDVKYEKKYGGSGKKYLVIRAADGSAYLQNRMINTAYLTPNAFQPGYTVDTIVKDLVGNNANLMAYQYGIAGSGSFPVSVLTTGVQSIPVYIQNIEFQQMSIFSALSQLAQYAGCTFYVQQTAGGQVLNFFLIGTNPSPVAITDNVITDFEGEDDGTNIVNVMYVDGGTQSTVDSSVSTTSFGNNPPTYAVNTYSASYSTTQVQPIYAQQFTAGNLNFQSLGLVIAKVQSNPLVPLAPFSGVIAYDDNDSPSMISANTPDAIPNGQFQITSDQVYDVPGLNAAFTTQGTTVFTTAQISATLIPAQKYWIVINSSINSNPASNHYWVYYAPTFYNAGLAPWASSSNGTTWTIQQTPGGPFCYEIVIQNGELSAPYDPTSISTYANNLFENSISSLGMTQGPNGKLAAYQLGLQLMGTGTTNYGIAKKKRFLRLHTVIPDQPIFPGQTVNVTCTDMGVTAQPFTAVQIQWDIKDVSSLDLSLWLQQYRYVS